VLRSVAGVISGYLVFAISAVLLFALSGRNPHAVQDLPFVVLCTLYGMTFAGIGGYLAAAINRRRPLLHATIVAGIIAVGATVSLLTSPATDATWSQWTALALMAPSAAAAGTVQGRKPRRG
jgi:hypothetical protein